MSQSPDELTAKVFRDRAKKLGLDAAAWTDTEIVGALLLAVRNDTARPNETPDQNTSRMVKAAVAVLER